MIELPKGQALCPAFVNTDIIAGLVYEHMTVEPVVIQTLDEKKNLLVLTESEDITKCKTLQSIEMWLGHSVNIGCNCYERQCLLICAILLELSRGTTSHLLLFILDTLQYTMLNFGFPSLHTLKGYERIM